jgi:hypothetical protein
MAIFLIKSSQLDKKIKIFYDKNWHGAGSGWRAKKKTPPRTKSTSSRRGE